MEKKKSRTIFYNVYDDAFLKLTDLAQNKYINKQKSSWCQKQQQYFQVVWSSAVLLVTWLHMFVAVLLLVDFSQLMWDLRET